MRPAGTGSSPTSHPGSAETRATTSGGASYRPGIDLDAVTIPELQEAMGSHRLTAVQLTEAYLERIRRLDPQLGAVIRVNDDAISDATASDEVRGRSGARSPLEGIPVMLKDNIATAGMPTTAGSLALADSEPGDATLTSRLRAAGAVVLGKANLSEWANFRSTNSTSGWSAVGGQARNPHVLDRNPCGSSSGSAVAVAASLAQVAIGTETDGSIVCPAGTTGVVGMKPTLGVVSRQGVVPITSEQDTPGPIARHVIDAALTLQVIAGPDPADPATGSAPEDTDTDYARCRPEALRGARIGVWRPSSSDQVDSRTREVFEQAVQTLTEAGATVVPVSLEHQDAIRKDEFAAMLAEFRRDIGVYLTSTPGSHPRDLAGLIDFGEQHAGLELEHFAQEIFTQAEAAAAPSQNPAAREARDRVRTLARRSIDDPLDEHRLNAVIALTNAPAWLITYFKQDGVGDSVGFGSSSAAAVAGYPNITVPAGFSGPGDALPIGVSFIGTGWDDAHVLELAAAFESVTHARRPPAYLPTTGEPSTAS
jgi:amidase